MSMYILKASHMTIKIGNSNVSYKLRLYISHNTFKSQMLHSVEALSPFGLSNGPFLGFLVGTSASAHFPRESPLPDTGVHSHVCTFHF